MAPTHPGKDTLIVSGQCSYRDYLRMVGLPPLCSRLSDRMDLAQASLAPGKKSLADGIRAHLPGEPYFFILYFFASSILSSSARDPIYAFHPGHHPACHLHRRPRMDLGLLSYFARKAHFAQFSPAMADYPPHYPIILNGTPSMFTLVNF